MEQIALKLAAKNLEQKMEQSDNLSSALITNVADYPDPDPTPVEMQAKTAAIRAKLVVISDAQTVVDKHNAELAVLEADLDDNMTLTGAYIQKTSKGDPAKLALLPVDLKSHATPTTPPAAITNFRMSPGINPGEVIVASDPDPGAVSYEHQQILDITKPDVTLRLDTSSGCRKTLTGFTSGTHIWVQRRSVGGKKTGNGPWCTPSVVTVP